MAPAGRSGYGRAGAGRVPAPVSSLRLVCDRRRDRLRRPHGAALVDALPRLLRRALRPGEHGPGGVQHGSRSVPADHDRRSRAAADEPAGHTRGPDPRLLRLALAGVAQPGDASRAAGRDRGAGRLAGVPPRGACAQGPAAGGAAHRRPAAVPASAVRRAGRVPPGDAGYPLPALRLPLHGGGQPVAGAALRAAGGHLQGRDPARDRAHGLVLRAAQAFMAAAARRRRRGRLLRHRHLGHHPALQSRRQSVHRPLRGVRVERRRGPEEPLHPPRQGSPRPGRLRQPALLVPARVALRLRVAVEPAHAAHRGPGVPHQRAFHTGRAEIHRLPIRGRRGALPVRGGRFRRGSPPALVRGRARGTTGAGRERPGAA